MSTMQRILRFSLPVILVTLSTIQSAGHGQDNLSSRAPSLASSPAALANGGNPISAAPLTNDDIIAMTQAKLADAVIVAKIRSSDCAFNTSPQALIGLKQSGISDVVLAAMAETGTDRFANKPEPDELDSEHDPGIYYLHPGGRDMTLLEPTAYSSAKTTGMLASLVTYGLAKTKAKGVVRGTRSATRVRQPRPTFYFYFEQKRTTLSNAGQSPVWFGELSAPSQFTLACLRPRKDSRDLVIGEFGILGASTGARDRDVEEFDFTKVSPGVYKVVPRKDLEPGEYCFFYAGQNTAPGTSGGSLFDFGVDRLQ